MAAQYFLHKDYHAANGVHRRGTTIEHDGPPGSYMEPKNEEAWDAHRAYRDERKAKGLGSLNYWFKFENEPRKGDRPGNELPEPLSQVKTEDIEAAEEDPEEEPERVPAPKRRGRPKKVKKNGG